MFIDQHQWRIVRRRETVALEQQQEEAGAAAVSRLHRVTVDLSSCEVEPETDLRELWSFTITEKAPIRVLS